MSGFIKIVTGSMLILGASSEAAVESRGAGHRETGTDYGDKGVEGYIKNGHGPDGALFVDPHLDGFLQKAKGRSVLDIGCGAGPWSIRAAQLGAKEVYGFDIQEKMIEKGIESARASKVSDKVQLVVGDAAKMPCKDSAFEFAMSNLVACNLPNDGDVFSKHFQELSRSLAEGGEAVVVAPSSLDVQFTNGANQILTLAKINSILDSLGIDPTTAQIAEAFQQIPQVLSATFAKDEKGKLFLVTDASKLKEGQQIWRKLPHVTVPNFYHSEAAYLAEFKAAGLKVTKVVKAHFSNDQSRLDFNRHFPLTPLGSEYVEHAPFTIYYAQKC